MKDTKLLVVFIVVIAAIASCNSGPASNSASSPANAKSPNASASTTPVDEARLGADLYAANCMTCHRDSGRGGKTTVEGKTITPEDLTDAEFKRASDEKLAQHISDGHEEDGMPAFKNKLTDDQIRLIVAHVRTLQK